MAKRPGRNGATSLIVKRRTSKSQLEDSLEMQMRAYGLPRFEREYKFHPDRKWRFDFFLEGWGIEIQGGGWVAGGGGHNRNPIKMWEGYEKYNAAMEMGIKVLLYTGTQIGDGVAITQLERIFK